MKNNETGGQVIVVSWNDAWGDAGSEVTLKDVADTHKPEKIHTMGCVLYEDETGVSLANERCANGSFRGRTYIPAGMVISIERFGLSKPRKTPRQPKGKPDGVVRARIHPSNSDSGEESTEPNPSNPTGE